MDKGIYVAASAGIAQERVMEIISNNLANLNTNGFKADRLMFSSYLPKNPGTATQPPQGVQPTLDSKPPTPEEIKRGVYGNPHGDTVYMVGSQSFTDFSQGSLRSTGNQLDISLDGSGFFAVQTPEGERFTRGGSFKLDSGGTLVTNEGFPVLDDLGNQIVLNGDSFAVKADGTMTNAANENLGRLKVVDFADKGNLEKVGVGVFKAVDPGLVEDSAAQVSQGFLEAANINPMGEITRMMNAMRAYESFQKSVQSHDQMDQRLIADVAR